MSFLKEEIAKSNAEQSVHQHPYESCRQTPDNFFKEEGYIGLHGLVIIIRLQTRFNRRCSSRYQQFPEFCRVSSENIEVYFGTNPIDSP